MKRRLNRAFDHMTMPDRCSHRIEEKLQEGLLQKKTGHYVKAAPPARPQRKIWAMAAAMVCLVLVLSVGATAVFLNLSEAIRMRSPVETAATIAAPAPTQAPGDYSLVTTYSSQRVEDFAKTVRHNVVNENWKALAEKVHYPITIQDQKIMTPEAFLSWMEYSPPSREFREAISGESCTGMFCNWQGICMANGEIWINEMDGSLRVSAFNQPVTEQSEESQQKKQVPLEFAAVLTGGTARFTDREEDMTIGEYCDSFLDVTGLPMVVKAFTVADMDADGTSEVVLHLVMQGTTDRDGDGISETVEEVDYGFVVLRLEGETVYGYPFRYGQMYGLKKDGSFSWAGSGPQQGESRLRFEGAGVYRQSFHGAGQGEKPSVQWHYYPCQRPELVLQSYEYVTGNGWSLLPGNQYYHFEGLVLGSMGNLWELQKDQLLRYGMICIEDEGTVTVFDPDAPGTALYGVLTNETGEVCFAEVGYYSCTEEKEYVGEARGLLTGAPEYWADAQLPFLGTMGRRLFTPEELVDYFGITTFSEEIIAQRYAAKAVAEAFTMAWLAQDEKGMKPYLTDDFQADENGYGAAEIYTMWGFPDRVPAEGETYSVMVELQTLEQKDAFSIVLELVKQKDSWKVKSCHF